MFIISCQPCQLFSQYWDSEYKHFVLLAMLQRQIKNPRVTAATWSQSQGFQSCFSWLPCALFSTMSCCLVKLLRWKQNPFAVMPAPAIPLPPQHCFCLFQLGPAPTCKTFAAICLSQTNVFTLHLSTHLNLITPHYIYLPCASSQFRLVCFTADGPACHSSQSTGVIDNLKNDSIEFRSATGSCMLANC